MDFEGGTFLIESASPDAQGIENAHRHLSTRHQVSPAFSILCSPRDEGIEMQSSLALTDALAAGARHLDTLEGP